MRPEYQSLLDVGSFGGTGDEETETVIGMFRFMVGFVHIIYNLFFGNQYHQVGGDKIKRFMLHLLGNPDSAVFCYGKLAFYNGKVGIVQIPRIVQIVRIESGTGNIRQVGGYAFGFREMAADYLINILFRLSGIRQTVLPCPGN